MSELVAVAQNTFGRSARVKALYVILAACVAHVWAMGLYGVLSIGNDQAMMFDAGLAFCLIVGMLTAMSGVFEVPRELKERTAQIVLAKPLGRAQFLLGKFLGISELCLFNIAIVAIGSAMAIKSNYGSVPATFYSGCALIAGEAIMLTAIGIFLSLIMSEAPAAVGLFVIFAVGHAIYMLPIALSGGAAKLSAIAGYVLPNFNHTDFKTLLGNGVELPKNLVLAALGYAVAYAAAVMSASVAIFQRQDVG